MRRRFDRNGGYLLLRIPSASITELLIGKAFVGANVFRGASSPEVSVVLSVEISESDDASIIIGGACAGTACPRADFVAFGV